MYIKTKTNIIFDENDPICRYVVSMAEGKTFAFIRCYQDHPENIKFYWGLVDETTEDSRKETITHIINYGSKWDQVGRLYDFEQ
ncbi:hypothetical protein [Klebsiella aerogenes]|uniref:hypothetical protein n=1 Tax=Klebsiella aerogenes TaxID=548 RepID=UPI002175B384|nr:hypothetical protein [Klebsiella aerogenes]UWC50061.1 hypothetical protein M5S98_28610 [Klebsiella aerogenes]HCJ5312679.1 hypothetical protein [Klebsiella aerogenes]